MTHITIARPGTLIALASSLLAMTAPAFASSIDNPLPQARINIARTDFTSARSVARLKAQLRRAALDICTTDGHHGVPMGADERQCYNTAFNDGATQIAARQEQAMRTKPVDLASALTDARASH